MNIVRKKVSSPERHSIRRSWPYNNLGNDLFNIMDYAFPNLFSTSARKNLSLDIKELNNYYIVEAEVPGYTEEDLSVTVDRGQLTISGKYTEVVEDDNYLVKERTYTDFARTIYLPDAVDGEKINAELKRGILKVYIPKAEDNHKKREIEILVND
jgi:HSP20 family protein